VRFMFGKTSLASMPSFNANFNVLSDISNSETLENSRSTKLNVVSEARSRG